MLYKPVEMEKLGLFDFLLFVDIVVVHTAFVIRTLMHIAGARRKVEQKKKENFMLTYYVKDNLLEWSIAYLAMWALLWSVPEALMSLGILKYWGTGLILLIGFSSKEITEFLIKTVPAALAYWTKKFTGVNTKDGKNEGV